MPLVVAKFGLRCSVILGGLLTTVGVLLSIFVPRVEYMFLTYGVMAGKLVFSSPDLSVS